jgi:L-lactate dehydrogenase complex protein LldG
MPFPAFRDSRDFILSRIRKALPQSAPLPEVLNSPDWQTFPDPVIRFTEVLGSVGGQVVQCSSLAAAQEHLESMPLWNTATVRYSAVSGLGETSAATAAAVDPHQLENVDFAVLRGHLAVAENGAVWVTDDTLLHRVLYFIPQHMAIVVPATSVLHNLHQAYSRIPVGQHRFAGFISGPSKTADIEQSLVIGAHGARSLTVYLVDGLPDLLADSN